MGSTFPGVAVVVFGGALVAAAVGLAALRRRSDPMARALTVLMFAVVAWAVPHGISLTVAEESAVVLWQRLRYPGTVVAPVAYLVVALRYAGYERWLSRRTYALLAVVPALTVVAVWTNPFHGLFWRSVSVATVGGASVLAPAFGPWYWVNLGYLYLVTLAGLAVLGAVVIRSGPVYRTQAVLMLAGGLVPLATNVAINFVAPDPTIDLTTTALSVTGVTFALALFHLDLLNIRPVARDRVLEELDDGVVVVGPDERIRDFNPTAAAVLDDLRVNQPAGTVLPSSVAPDGGELVVETDAGERVFRTRSTPLVDARGEQAGRIVYLNDVTEIVEREQRLSVLNRILRHNLRNELNVASSHLTFLRDRGSVPAEDREHVAEARQSIQRVVEFAEKARDVERTLRTSDAAVVVAVPAIVERVVTDAREQFPDAEIERGTLPGGENAARARVVDEELFERALAELVENAVVHHDREHPSVTVETETTDDRVRVRVVDDGPGIPDYETEALLARTETSLDHGSGLGLWLTRWIVSRSSGELSFEANDPRGSVVTVSLPAADR